MTLWGALRGRFDSVIQSFRLAFLQIISDYQISHWVWQRAFFDVMITYLTEFQRAEQSSCVLRVWFGAGPRNVKTFRGDRSMFVIEGMVMSQLACDFQST